MSCLPQVRRDRQETRDGRVLVVQIAVRSEEAQAREGGFVALGGFDSQ